MPLVDSAALALLPSIDGAISRSFVVTKSRDASLVYEVRRVESRRD